MIELLRMLILGKVIALSPVQADLTQTPVLFSSKELLTAVNAGAYASIDVSAAIPVANAPKDPKQLQVIFPSGCIRAEGIGSNGAAIALSSQTIAISAGNTFIDLSEAGGANPKTSFNAIRVSACHTIPQVSVKWHNFKE